MNKKIVNFEFMLKLFLKNITFLFQNLHQKSIDD